MTNEVDQRPQCLKEALTTLMLYQPFFASLLLDIMEIHMVSEGDERSPMDTAATDGKRIYITTEWFSELTIPERVFLISHEVMHGAWLHLVRAKFMENSIQHGKPFNFSVWNQAGDYVINALLVKSNVGQMPEGGLLSHRFSHTQSVDSVYEELMQEEDDKPDNKKSGKGQPGEGGKGFDHHVPRTAEVGESEVQMKQAITTAGERAKAAGKCPAAIREWIQGALAPTVHWRKQVRMMVQKAACKEAKTWKKPHRRKIYRPGIYMPSRTGHGAGTIVIGFDTSGSVSDVEIKKFFGEMSGILTDTNPKRIVLIYCDAEVQGVEEVNTPADLSRVQRKGVPGRGGTMFQPVFDYIEKHKLKPDTCIYLTDLYPCDNPEEPSYPVIWCSTGKDKASWGKVVMIDD